ncbi:MAG: sulfatase [Phycisphaerae bacterium]|nr:sulfatase-like hydrolase/transferase [Phycisphaerae bacterium]NUQ44779.1 sulfatase [Phycisphaerae bacterium]
MQTSAYSDGADGSAALRATWPGVVVSSALLGLAGGAVYALCEVAFVATDADLYFPVASVAIYGILVLFLSVPLGLIVWGGASLLGWRLSARQQWAVHAALLLQLLLVLLLRPMLVLLLAPVPWLTCAWLANRRALNDMRWAWSLCAIATAACLLAADVLGWKRSTGGGVTDEFGAALTAVAVFTVAVLLVRLLKRGTLAVSTALVVVVAVGSAWSWRPFGQINTPAPSLMRPNIVLIVLDTMRRDVLGCYGGPPGLTSCLDQLARESAVYDDAYSPAAWTLPAHASLITGLFPRTHGCRADIHHWIDEEMITLPEMLQRHGYQTAAICSNAVLDGANFEQGFERFECVDVPMGLEHMRITRLLQLLGLPDGWIDKGSVRSTCELVNWLDHERDRERPFFLFVNLLEPHQPYLAPLRHRAAVIDNIADLSAASWLGANQYESTEWDIRRVGPGRNSELARKMYEAEVRYQDDALAELIEDLSARVELDQTLLIVTADHGESLGENGRWGHLFVVNDAVLRVPLLIRFPSRFPAGSRITGICHLTDIVPTIFDVLNEPCPQDSLPGRSLAPDEFRGAEYAYSEWTPGAMVRRVTPRAFRKSQLSNLRVLRGTRFKLVWSSGGDHQLFDLQSDPAESHNLYRVNEEISRSMEFAMEKLRDALPQYSIRENAPSAPLDDRHELRLKHLGYIH